MTRWDRVEKTLYLFGPCDITARIDVSLLRYWLHIEGRSGSLAGEVFPTMSAAKRAGKREMKRLAIEERNRAQGDAIECDEWLRVNT